MERGLERLQVLEDEKAALQEQLKTMEATKGAYEDQVKALKQRAKEIQALQAEELERSLERSMALEGDMAAEGASKATLQEQLKIVEASKAALQDEVNALQLKAQQVHALHVEELERGLGRLVALEAEKAGGEASKAALQEQLETEKASKAALEEQVKALLLKGQQDLAVQADELERSLARTSALELERLADDAARRACLDQIHSLEDRNDALQGQLKALEARREALQEEVKALQQQAQEVEAFHKAELQTGQERITALELDRIADGAARRALLDEVRELKDGKDAVQDQLKVSQQQVEKLRQDPVRGAERLPFQGAATVSIEGKLAAPALGVDAEKAALQDKMAALENKCAILTFNVNLLTSALGEESKLKTLMVGGRPVECQTVGLMRWS